ncbi:hypothetical protein [Lysinibacillus sp. NPDC056185]|uniref:hypothetical protein n=1 Tax=Lysinibacillus sp. NPDC056185 TaxID=3345739 RepID=UPI0039EEEAB7
MEKLKVSNRMKVNIIVCLIGFIFIGYFTAKHYIRVTNCMESSRDGLLYDKDLCYRNIDNNREVEDWEQYKRDMKDAKFKHDLYEEVERMNK